MSIYFPLAMHHDKHGCRPPCDLGSVASLVTSNEILSNRIKVQFNHRQRDTAVQGESILQAGGKAKPLVALHRP